MRYLFEVQEDEDGQRLDRMIVSHLANKSRSFIQKCIKKGLVKVNGKLVTKRSFRVSKTEEIEVEVKKDSKQGNYIRPSPMPIDIVYRDKDLLVVNKRAGVPVHPAKGNRDKTLINGLLYKFKELVKVGTPVKFGLVHRIDKDTSGVILVALNSHALWYFSRQFEEREVGKYYVAVVSGEIKKIFRQREKFACSNYIGRHPKDRKKMAVVAKEKGKLATTNFYYLESSLYEKLGRLSLVIAEPKTGRTHQVRVHLSHLGYPIIGDGIYGKKKFSRMLLHAYMIKCKMLDGNIKVFKAPIGDEFSDLFDIPKILAKIEKQVLSQ